MYDAWGRMSRFDSDYEDTGGAGNGDVPFVYDALNRRMIWDGEVHYHTKDWQVIEERDEATGTLDTQIVWSPAYVDAMVLRDRNADASTDGSLEERLYVLHDANFNVTAIADETSPDDWTIVERYLFDPYGERTILDADWSNDADATSDALFDHGFQGGRHFNTLTLAGSLVHFRNRDHNTSFGRWMRQDPAGYVDGANLFLSHLSNTVTFLDPTGLKIATPMFDPGADIHPHQKPGMADDMMRRGRRAGKNILATAAVTAAEAFIPIPGSGLAAKAATRLAAKGMRAAARSMKGMKGAPSPSMVGPSCIRPDVSSQARLSSW